MSERERLPYCGQCGNRLQPGDRFCGECGSAVLPPPPQAEQIISREEAAAQGAVHAPRRRKRLWINATAISLILLVSVGAVGALAFSDGLSLLGGSDPRSIGNPVGDNPTQREETQDPESSSVPPDSPPDSTGTDDLEAEVEEAAGDYYRAAGVEDWDYTYEHLDSETQSRFTREEWFEKNQWLTDNYPAIYHIESVNLDSTSPEHVAEVVVGLTYEDGSSASRNTFFVFEGGEWKHRFSQDEYDLLMPGVPFEEFVEAP